MALFVFHGRAAMKQPGSKRFLKFLLPVLILAGALSVGAYLRATRPEIPAEPPQERVWPVAVAEAELRDQRPVYHLDGEVVAAREAALRPLVAGPVLAVNPFFAEGAAFRRGDWLVRIDPFDYEAAVREREADLREARARIAEIEAELAAERLQLERDRDQAALARQDLRRKEELFANGTIAQKALDDARLVASEREQRVVSREQSIARQEARLEQARAAADRVASALERARRSLADTELKAPFDGFLSEPKVAVGALVGTNDVLGRLIAADGLEVRFHIPDAVYRGLLAGNLRDTPVKVVWRVGTRSLDFDAVVQRIEGRVSAASGGVEAYAPLLDQGLSTPLRPGTFVQVALPGPVEEKVARLPQRALHHGRTLYVVVDGRLESRDVRPVAHAGEDVLVRGDLRDGEQVVLTRFPEIAAGLKVAVR